jgi:hypothetical protein
MVMSMQNWDDHGTYGAFIWELGDEVVKRSCTGDGHECRRQPHQGELHGAWV